MPRIRSVDEILALQVLSDTPDKLARKYLVKRVDELVRNSARDQLDSVSFEVPCIIVFRPRYDRDVVTNALHKHYTKLGFGCTVDEYTLTISWGASSSDEDSKCATEKGSTAQDDDSTQSEQEDQANSEEDEPLALKFNIEGPRPSMAKRVEAMKAKKA